MTLYYEQDGVTIYHGDCLDVITIWEGQRTHSFDLLLTDPPYGLKKDGRRGETGPSGSQRGGRKGYEFLGWDHVRPDVNTFARLRTITRHQIIWGGNYFVDSITPSMKWLVWDKGQRIDQSDAELAWTSLPGALRVCNLHRVHLWNDGPQHPTQKPEDLMLWCLVQAGDVRTVLDPFMGSGTTLVAAKRLGMAATGIEREERYCEIAAKRLSQGVLPIEKGA